MSSPPRRHNPPTYEEDQAADPYVYDDGDGPSYEDPNYLEEDPNPRLADEDRQETDEDRVMMHQREADAAEFEVLMRLREKAMAGWRRTGMKKVLGEKRLRGRAALGGSNWMIPMMSRMSRMYDEGKGESLEVCGPFDHEDQRRET